MYVTIHLKLYLKYILLHTKFVYLFFNKTLAILVVDGKLELYVKLWNVA